jgi:hypothetical protein
MIQISVSSSFLLIIISVINVEGFNFLAKLSDHSESYSLKTEYYVSQQIEFNWVDSFLFCKSNGLKLAKNLHNEDFDKLFGELRNSNLRSGDFKLFVDGSDSLDQSVCSIIVDNSTNSFRNESCTNEKHGFLCQSVGDIDKNNINLQFGTNNKLRSFKRLNSNGEKKH